MGKRVSQESSGNRAEGCRRNTVFRLYFNDEQRLKEVAGALHGRSYARDPLKIVTLDGTFLSQIKNDISFLLAQQHLIFMEHQSTANKNMAWHCVAFTMSVNNGVNTYPRRNCIRTRGSNFPRRNSMYSIQETAICLKRIR